MHIFARGGIEITNILTDFQLGTVPYPTNPIPEEQLCTIANSCGAVIFWTRIGTFQT
jgi:hypothetical protein